MLTAEPLVLSLHGEFDIYSRDRFAEILAAADGHPYVVLDFSGVPYIDSTCLSVLVRLRKRRAAAGLPPAHFAGMSAIMRRVFGITALDQIWPMFDTVDEARAAFRKAPPPYAGSNGTQD